MVQIRLANAEDLPALVVVEKKAFGPRQFPETLVREFLVDPDVITMVVEDERIVAYTMLRVSQAYETAEVLSLAVSPSYRRRGLGRKLLESLEGVAREYGMGTIMLCVRPDNLEATALYVSQGYTVLALCQGYYEDGSDAQMMVKHLEG
jgi:ribosomal-protein-alanine N-acetyltransferase